MSSPRPLLLVALFATVVPSATRSAQEPAPAPASNLDARSLFMTYCAACHGETGDGNGTTKLDRPARSFKDGGFSYGNTPEVIAKTLQYGIPGSVMPSFGKALTDEQRLLLAKYVIQLGPQDLPTESPDRVLVVKDRAVVARGKLPPILEGGEEIPRGLLVGTPDGFTFAYRTDDLRLLAVYQGEFAERTDWMGRGGTQLKPLGKLVATYGMGNPESAWRLRSGLTDAEAACRTRFIGTQVEGGKAVVRYELWSAGGALLARIEEVAQSDDGRYGRGWSRRLRIENPQAATLALTLSSSLDLSSELTGEIATRGRQLRTLSDGSAVLDSLQPCRDSDGLLAGMGRSACQLGFEPNEKREVWLTTSFVAQWNEAVEQAWRAEVSR